MQTENLIDPSVAPTSILKQAVSVLNIEQARGTKTYQPNNNRQVSGIDNLTTEASDVVNAKEAPDRSILPSSILVSSTPTWRIGVSPEADPFTTVAVESTMGDANRELEGLRPEVLMGGDKVDVDTYQWRMLVSFM